MPVDHLRSFNDLTDAIGCFHSSLSLGLQKLEELLCKDFITVDWLQQGVNFLRSSHASALNLVERLQLPVAAKGEEWINAYMDETVKLLDVCDALNKGIPRLEECANLAQNAAEALQQGINNRGQLNRALQTLNACREQMTRMDHDNQQLIEIIETEGKMCMNIDDRHVGLEYANSSGYWGVIYPMRNTSSFISKILLSGVLHLGSSHCFETGTVCSQSSWALSIYNLQQSMSKQISLGTNQERGKTILLQEFGRVHTSLAKLWSQVQSLHERGVIKNEIRMSEVKKLSVNSKMLKCGLDDLEWHVNDLFDDIVQGRRKLLSTMSQSSGKI